MQPVRADDIVALMLPAWGTLLGHVYGDHVVSENTAKHFRPEVRDAYQALARGGAPVTADAVQRGVEQMIRDQLAPFENRVPTEAELAKLPKLVRERYQDFQRVRREASLRARAETDPFPEGIVDRKYFTAHLELKELELAEKMIGDHQVIERATSLIRTLKGKRPKVLPDGTTLKVVVNPKDIFNRPLFIGGGGALEITTARGETIHVHAAHGMLEVATRQRGSMTYFARSFSDELERGTGTRKVKLGRLFDLRQKFMRGADAGVIKDVAIALDGAKNRGAAARKIESAYRKLEHSAVALWGEYMIRGEWPAKLAAIAEHLTGRRAMQIDNGRTRISVKDTLELELRDDDPKKLTLREGGPFIHVREMHGNRDFAVSIPALGEGRLDLVLIGDRREAERVLVGADGKMPNLDLRLPALGNFEEDLETAFARIRGKRD
jgi:hypothetical protein